MAEACGEQQRSIRSDQINSSSCISKLASDVETINQSVNTLRIKGINSYKFGVWEPNPRLLNYKMQSKHKYSHSVINPAIFYWGTPVVLVTTLNEDGSTNIAPISSAFWLGNTGILGFGPESKTPANLLRTRQCVLNLASDSMAGAVNALARTTGSDPVPLWKKSGGYSFEKDKFRCAGLTAQHSELVEPDRIAECPVQMEAELVGTHAVGQDLDFSFGINVFEVRVLQTYVHDDIRMSGYENRVDPDKWRPMIMAFQELYGLQPHKLVVSRLGQIDEENYRVPQAVQKTTKNGLVDNGGLTS